MTNPTTKKRGLRTRLARGAMRWTVAAIDALFPLEANKADKEAALLAELAENDQEYMELASERDTLQARAEAAELALDEERGARDALLAEVIRETGAGTATTNPEFGPQSEAEVHIYKREELRVRVLSLVAQAERRARLVALVTEAVLQAVAEHEQQGIGPGPERTLWELADLHVAKRLAAERDIEVEAEMSSADTDTKRAAIDMEVAEAIADLVLHAPDVEDGDESADDVRDYWLGLFKRYAAAKVAEMGPPEAQGRAWSEVWAQATRVEELTGRLRIAEVSKNEAELALVRLRSLAHDVVATAPPIDLTSGAPTVNIDDDHERAICALDAAVSAIPTDLAKAQRERAADLRGGK